MMNFFDYQYISALLPVLVLYMYLLLFHGHCSTFFNLYWYCSVLHLIVSEVIAANLCPMFTLLFFESQPSYYYL